MASVEIEMLPSDLGLPTARIDVSDDPSAMRGMVLRDGPFATLADAKEATQCGQAAPSWDRYESILERGKAELRRRKGIAKGFCLAFRDGGACIFAALPDGEIDFDSRVAGPFEDCAAAFDAIEAAQVSKMLSGLAEAQRNRGI